MLTLLAALAAVTAILADVRRRHPLFYVAKPLATVLILAGVASAVIGGSVYGRWIAGAGLLCLLGDLLLMGEGPRAFVAGLTAFLIAHLLFVVAFRSDGVYAPPTWSLAVATSGIIAAGAFARRAGRLHLAVATYAAALLAMFVCAAARDATWNTPATRAALAGAALFAVSDGVLAWRRFVRPFAGGQALTLATYYTALWLIVRSVPTGIHA